jgi:hypothetical protein
MEESSRLYTKVLGADQGRARSDPSGVFGRAGSTAMIRGEQDVKDRYQSIT